MTGKKIVGATVALLFATAAYPADAGKQVKWSSALELCQGALKMIARDPEAAKVPVVYPMPGGADWRFLWAPHTKQVRMRNGLGVEVAVGAFCVVDEDTGRIKLLTLDGKQFVTPGR
ncbi:MAG: hypothetical protein LT082_08845 [Comamonas sp.]|nr:hypothetical protein [Comamonas sp.]